MNEKNRRIFQGSEEYGGWFFYAYFLIKGQG